MFKHVNVARVNPWTAIPWLLALVLLLPVGAVGLAAIFSPSGLDTWVHLIETVFPGYLFRTLTLMMLVGFGVIAIGVPAAWLTILCRFPGDRFFDWALLLPMAMPAYVTAYTYTGLLDFSGPIVGQINEWFPSFISAACWPSIRNVPGAAFILTLALYPYVYFLARAAFLEQSVCVLEVARTLGYSSFQVFWRVAMPLARPSIAAGLALVLMETMGDFGTVQYFGVGTLATGIYRTWRGLGDLASAIQMAVMLIVMAAVLVYLERYSRGSMSYFHTTGRYRPIPGIMLHGWKKWLAWAACLVPLAAGFIIPAATLGFWAALHVQKMNYEGFFRIARNSLSMAFFSAIIILAAALLLTYALRITRERWSRIAIRLSGFGYAIPGTVLAVGILVPLSALDHRMSDWAKEVFGLGTGLIFSGTLFAITYAYFVRFLAVGTNVMEASFQKISPHLDDAARSLGKKPGFVLWAIHIPLLKPSLLTALVLLFVDIMKELPATLILRPFNFDTLATTTYYLAADERLREAAVPSLSIALFGMLPVYLLARSIRKARPGSEIKVRP